ncbi:INO80 complex, subunit Ies4 [Xylaria flabelliformis]|nr:INO80 complex, subunit Ies4 [Xylaria flabelliformis]KAI0856418.1 INO80 complex, subunit Ies4 [Xylaria cubensis]
MAPTTKTSASHKEKDRRKSNGKSPVLVTLRVPSDRLRKILDPSWVDEETLTKESAASSPGAPNDIPVAAASQDDNASPSSPGTPAASGTPSQTPMGPPTDNLKKKGVKRSAAAANNDPAAKIRGKPGPKKKARLEDGSIDPNGRAGGSAYHKLGPKANQGAINAGLRALDRSGAPCRKWTKGGFRLKSFTGVLWEIPRWTAPPKSKQEGSTEEATASADSSNKENKEDSQMKSENSTSNVEGELRSIPPSVHASSPAPIAITAS